ncbi:dihydroorotase family protein [Microbacterium sp. NPDC057659]|uniref:dihydroorotase n=1 Tax=Microbacterium sp. NPDC057659 TaxID=3346198 RepID=UPI00366B83C0
MTFDLLITNATIVNADGAVRASIGIEDGTVTALLAPDAVVPDAVRTIDANGLVAIPGGVDGHCHAEQTTGAYRSLDTYASTTSAALRGGTTTIIDFGIPDGTGQTPIEALERKIHLVSENGARCDVALHGSVITWDDSTSAQLERMAELGVHSVKMYTTNRGSTMSDDDTIVRVLHEMVRLDGLAYIHAEHDGIIHDRTTACADRGAIGIEHLHESRPEISEDASVREILAVAEYTGAPVYFVHQSTPAAVDAVAEARGRGLNAFSEVCPHYLLHDESVYSGLAPEKFACCPPFRSSSDVAGLRARVNRGLVDTLSSDHTSYDLAQKREHSDDVRHMPHGLPGAGTRMPAGYTAMVVEEGLPIEDFVALFSANPARVNGLHRKGAVAVGNDADIVLFDPEERRVVRASDLHQDSDFSPFDGMELAGWPRYVVSGGHVVVDAGEFADPGPVGRYIGQAPFSERPGITRPASVVARHAVSA